MVGVCSVQRRLVVLRIKYRTEIGFVGCVFTHPILKQNIMQLVVNW